LPKPQTGKTPLVCCPRIFIQCSYPPFMKGVSSIRRMRTCNTVMRGPLILECPGGMYPKRKIDISKSHQCTIVHLQMETLKHVFFSEYTYLKRFQCEHHWLHDIHPDDFLLFFDTFGSMLWVTVVITSSLRAFSYWRSLFLTWYTM